jgi:uncharacterized delta-60 repeat protein
MRGSVIRLRRSIGALALVACVLAGGALALPGALDSTFGSNGIALMDLSAAAELKAIAVQKDGKIVVAGRGAGSLVVARFTSTGSLDPTFGSGGIVEDVPGEAFAVAVQKDGKIVVAGDSSVGPTQDFAVARYTSAGTLDPTFGTGGVALTDFDYSTDFATAIAIQKDGKIVVAGSSTNIAGSTIAVARYLRSGALDRTFGIVGQVETNLGGNTNYANALAIQKNGRIVVAGSTDATGSNDVALVRLTRAGALDPTFGTGGKVHDDLGSSSDDSAVGVAVQKDGKVVLTARTNAGSSRDFSLMRFTTDGHLDTSFGSGGLVLSDLGSASEDEPSAIALQKDGKIVVAGSSDAGGTADFALARYTPAGALDPGFGSSGVTLTDLPGNGVDFVFAMAIQKDGRIVVAGRSDGGGPFADYFPALARYQAQ